MILSLVITAFFMGLAASPHCMAMCGAACAGAQRVCVGQGLTPWRSAWGVGLGRVLGYAAGGAAAAAGLGFLEWLAQQSPAVRPLWTLFHALSLALGLWLMATGRQPPFFERFGRTSSASAAVVQLPGRRRQWRAQLQSLAFGGLWVAWPCGILQSALVLAALANHAWGGAAVMVSFAVASSPGLFLMPWLTGWLNRASWGASGLAWAIRVSGLVLALASLWALARDVLRPVAAWCGLPVH